MNGLRRTRRAALGNRVRADGLSQRGFTLTHAIRTLRGFYGVTQESVREVSGRKSCAASLVHRVGSNFCVAGG